MLCFRSEAHVDAWCLTRGLPRRPLVDLGQLWHLAVHWYGNRLTVDSRRPAPEEMTRIFAEVGLTDPFWDPSRDAFRG
jgi:hypothetical protein